MFIFGGEVHLNGLQGLTTARLMTCKMTVIRLTEASYPRVDPLKLVLSDSVYCENKN